MSAAAGQTILVVDDSEDVRELTALQLRLAGYEVFEARDGREAIEIARRHRPALVLMDINMPVLDGLAATRLLRQVKELCHICIVAFSAFGDGESRRLALEAGCDDYVSKPAGIAMLLEIVQRHLSAP